MKLTGVIVAVIVALLAWKVMGNLAVQAHPPASCQLFGGHWSLLTGWQCG